MDITLIVTALRGLSIILNNPLLGGGSNVRIDQASDLLQSLALLVSEGDEGVEELEALTTLISEMAASSRAPTTAEWSGLRVRLKAARKLIAEADAKLAADVAGVPGQHEAKVAQDEKEAEGLAARLKKKLMGKGDSPDDDTDDDVDPLTEEERARFIVLEAITTLSEEEENELEALDQKLEDAAPDADKNQE